VAGNCVAIKPASYAPSQSHALAKLVGKYLDKDAVTVFEGDRHVTDAMLKLRFDMIFFTGSGYVGRIIAKAAAEHLTPVVLELGGKSPCIVDKSADLDVAASRLVWGAFLNSGQTCIRPDHVLVHADVADAFIAKCKAKIAEFYSADPQKTEFFGRIINAAAVERLAGLVEASKGKIAHGGRVDKADKYVEPTLIDYGADLAAFDAAPTMQDEIFGPLLPIGRWRDLEQDVIQRVRRLPTGKPLALYLFASDKRVIEAVKLRTTSGGCAINDALVHIIEPTIGFGGVGQSGMGSYHGKRSFEAFSHERAIVEKSNAVDGLPVLAQVLAVRFPPYTPLKMAVVRSLTNPNVARLLKFLESRAFQRVVLLVLGASLAKMLGFRVVYEP